MTNNELAPWDAIFALADGRNTPAAHMIMTYDASDYTLGDMIRTGFGVDTITDSVIDDLLDELDGADDDNEEM
jgi:hypothetical protein